MTQMTINQALDFAWRHRQAGQLAEAESICRQVLAAYPQNADAMSMLGIIVSLNGQMDEAIDLSHRALAMQPDVPLYLCRLGSILFADQRYDQAIQVYRKAIAIQPDYVDLHNDLGNALKQLGDVSGAMAAYRQAIALSPSSPIPHNNLGLMLLMLGDFKQGFAEYAWRWKALTIFNQQLPQPMWDGSDIAGRRILIRAEQGFGDALHFGRYIPLLAERGARILFACKPELLRLMRSLHGYESILTQGDPIPEFDVHSTLLDLPGLMQTTPDAIPVNVPYLSPDPIDVANWRDRLAQVPGTKVGICWAGSKLHSNDRNRSISFDQFLPILQSPGISFVSLQKGSSAPNTPVGVNLIDHTANLQDFADTAALIANLDLVITVDTSVAHVAGAMGKPVWVLIPFMPDWRWMLDREDSPWYPSMQLFRQPRPRDWASPVQKIVKKLHEVADQEISLK